MPGTSPNSSSNPALPPKRGPLWIFGRILLFAAAATAFISFLLTSRKLPDNSPAAVREMRRLEVAEALFVRENSRYATPKELALEPVEHYTFTVRANKANFSIVAIPDDPRQKSLYTDETLVIRSSPGTQAANADSPILR